MTEFDIELNRVRNNISSLSQAEKNLKHLSSNVFEIQKSITFQVSGRAQLMHTLNNIEASVLKEASKMGNMAQALSYIHDRYVRSEQAASSERSLVDRIRDGMDAAMYDMMKAMGLGQLYIQHKYPLESFDEARVQEKLMDQYLQYKCFELLSTPKYSEEKWNNASVAEREQMIRDFIVDVNAVLGTTTAITVIFDDGEGNTKYNGYFDYHDDGTAVIYINPERIQTGDRAVFNTAIHESRHCYQHSAVDNPESYIVSEETLEQWAENLDPKNYKSGGSGDAYYSQPVEWDTFHFAHQEYRTDGITPDYEGSWSADGNDDLFA